MLGGVARRSGKRSLETALAALRAHGADPGAPAARAAIRDALGSPIGLVVAAAARLVAEAELVELVPLFAPVWARFLADPARSDPGCQAKGAVVEALCRLERDPDDVLLRAVRYRQPEPAWGPPVDTAAGMRGHAALGLARAQHPAAPIELAHLLADREWVARAGAARALGCVVPATSAPLLRFKVLVGDEEPRVLGECFASLLAVDAAGSVGFVGDRLDGLDDAVAEQAAVALGESRLPAAFDRLRAWCEGLGGGPQARVALLAIALLRSDAGREYLLERVGAADRQTAALALDALAIHRHDPRVRDRVNAALAARKDRDRAPLPEAAARFRDG